MPAQLPQGCWGGPRRRALAPHSRPGALSPACHVGMREAGRFQGVGSWTAFALTWGQPSFVTFSDTFSAAAASFQWSGRRS